MRAARGHTWDETGTAAPRGALRGVQILLPVWGPTYLRQCLDVLLPSLLASGNLPAVAAEIPAVFILSTRERDIPEISRHPCWRALAAICEARLESLDELLSEARSVVLTLVYARAIRAAGNAARDTGFLLLVADYVLADGALRAVLRRLQGGASAVLAGNFHVDGATTRRRLAGQAPGAVLSISPRALVRLGLDSLHPATRACMPGGTMHDGRANRVFWPMGSDALLGRFYLLHPIAIRPETQDVCIAAPCDYSFVPEFCPSGRVETVTDSDDYMVAELQQAVAQDLRPGPLAPAALAGSLASWVTKQHRENALQPICFHAGGLEDMADGFAPALAASAQFVAATGRLLRRRPHPHRHHPNWGGMLAHHHATALHPVDDSALTAILGAGAVPGGLGRARRLLLGRMPEPRPWHPRWADWLVLRQCLAAHAAGRRVLIVSAESGCVNGEMARAALAGGAKSAAVLEPDGAFAAAAGPAGPRFDFVLAVLRPAALPGMPDLAAAFNGLLAADGLAILAISNLSDQPANPLTAAGIDEVAAGAAPALLVARVETVSAPRWRIAAQAGLMRHARAATQARPLARIVHFAAGMACAAASFAANLACLRRRATQRLGSSSTVLVHLRPAPPAVTPASAIQRTRVRAWTA